MTEHSSSDRYSLVPATSIDDAALLAFTAAVWPDLSARERADRYWWRRCEPRCALAAVHEASGAMAGLCAGRPVEWIIGGELHPAVAISDWYVHPAHAGRGLGKRLVQNFEAPGRFLYAISLSDAAIANFKRLGWRGAYASSLMLLPLPRLARLVDVMRGPPAGIGLQDHIVTAMTPPADLAAALDRLDARTRSKASRAHMRRDAAEWGRRLAITPGRTYRFCVAAVAGEPAGYVVVRRLTPGRIRALARFECALVVDLVADDPTVARVLTARAVAMAAALSARVALAVTTVPDHERIARWRGFVTPRWPVIGKQIAQRAPSFMWVPQGPGAGLTEADFAMTLADGPIDFDL